MGILIDDPSVLYIRIKFTLKGLLGLYRYLRDSFGRRVHQIGRKTERRPAQIDGFAKPVQLTDINTTFTGRVLGHTRWELVVQTDGHS